MKILSDEIKRASNYVFVTPEQITSTTDETNDTVSVQLSNKAINIVPLTSGIKYLNITFPEIIIGYSRDFFIRLIITGDVPSISFSEYGGGLPNFDVADSQWEEVEQGVNILMFSETAQP